MAKSTQMAAKNQTRESEARERQGLVYERLSGQRQARNASLSAPFDGKDSQGQARADRKQGTGLDRSAGMRTDQRGKAGKTSNWREEEQRGSVGLQDRQHRSEERRVGKECRS